MALCHGSLNSRFPVSLVSPFSVPFRVSLSGARRGGALASHRAPEPRRIIPNTPPLTQRSYPTCICAPFSLPRQPVAPYGPLPSPICYPGRGANSQRPHPVPTELVPPQRPIIVWPRSLAQHPSSRAYPWSLAQEPGPRD